ncbi:hypothetical protein H5P28_00780 [Ruficoccus amylovorans]|uniref:Uncharacterized protein n=1 Tax=Ruficoccus amylovorans TaxID=1804625 RepID=A0A842H969_9BACT|nr:hypothetical protein [Ruficoccus amylovorans]MBC2592785.1 hypothetical protein [Ruficoccus amylovorans]
MNTTPNKQLNMNANNAIISGGINLAVHTNAGTEETVTVRLLKIREFPDYLRLVDQEERLAEFLCDKPEGWADTLTVDSLLDICEQGHGINFKNACRWGERRAQVNEALLPIAASGKAVAQQFPQVQG